VAGAGVAGAAGGGADLGLVYAPVERYQGDSYRIIYIHVPASSGALMGYIAMGVAGLVALVWRMKMAEVMLKALAPFGAALAAVSLLTGALWGKPTWGTYWQWDARMTSMLILLFLYLGIMALQNAIRDPRQAARAAALLAVVGVINVVIVKYSVEWLNTLHQGATLKVVGGVVHRRLDEMAAADQHGRALVAVRRQRADPRPHRGAQPRAPQRLGAPAGP
jgi:heme exporter protein C